MGTEHVGSRGGHVLPQLDWPGQDADLIQLWDTSQSPATNDRTGKLGGFQSKAGAVVSFYDDPSGRAAVADAYTGHLYSSIAPFEPDNWALRLHQGNDGPDNVWALRLIADHTNQSNSRSTRNTFVIDQETSQLWAELMDLFVVGDRKTSVNGPELAFNGAGFLGAMVNGQDPSGSASASSTSGQPVATGSQTRGALALSLHRNLGHVADTTKIAQLAQMLVFLTPTPKPKSTATDGGGGGLLPTPTVSSDFSALTGNIGANSGTILQGGTQNQLQIGPGGQIQINGQPIGAPQASPIIFGSPGQGNRPSTPDEVGLRADTGIMFDPQTIARFTNEGPAADPSDDGDDTRLVTLFVMQTLVSPDDHLDTHTDPNSNHLPMAKTVPKNKIAGWVKTKAAGNEHYDYSWHHPPPGQQYSTSTGGGSSGGGGNKPTTPSSTQGNPPPTGQNGTPQTPGTDPTPGQQPDPDHPDRIVQNADGTFTKLTFDSATSSYIPVPGSP